MSVTVTERIAPPGAVHPSCFAYEILRFGSYAMTFELGVIRSGIQTGGCQCPLQNQFPHQAGLTETILLTEWKKHETVRPRLRWWDEFSEHFLECRKPVLDHVSMSMLKCFSLSSQLQYTG